MIFLPGKIVDFNWKSLEKALNFVVWNNYVGMLFWFQHESKPCDSQGLEWCMISDYRYMYYK